MLAQYDERFYQPALPLAARLAGSGAAPARALATWLRRFDEAWPHVRLDQLRAEPGTVAVGAPLVVEAEVELAGLRPADVAVDLLIGPLNDLGEIEQHCLARLAPAGPVRSGRARYRSEPLRLEASGAHGLLARLTPNHPDLLPAQARARAHWGP
jgi:starch phosphorylase